jgi:hypothetical protein
MADEEVTDTSVPDDPVQGLEREGADASLIDTFKQELQELAETRTVMIPVKGYERTGLQVKYAMPETGKQLDAIARKVNREVKDTYSRNLFTAMDTMIALCDGLYVQPDDVPEPVMLDPNSTGAACYFDSTLAEMMGMNGSQGSARQVVKRLFGDNDMAIMSHAERLSRWLQNTKADLEVEFWQVGE